MGTLSCLASPPFGDSAVVRRFWVYASTGRVDEWKRATGRKRGKPSDLLPFRRPAASPAAQLPSAAGVAKKGVGWKLRTRHW